MPPYRRTLAALALLLFTLAACSGTPLPRGDTPEAAVEQLLRQDPKAPRDTQPHVHVHGTRNTPHGVVVLYSAEYRTPQGQVMAERSSYALLDRYQGQWFPASATINGPPDEATMPPVEFYEWPMTLETGKALIVYGWTKPQLDITTIEVVLDAGPPLRDTVTEGMFAVVAPDAGATVVCELRAFDAGNQVVYTYPGDAVPPYAPADPTMLATRCRP